MKFKTFILSNVLFFCLAIFSRSYGAAIAPDPTRFSAGARVLGMGRAFVGLSDDTSALYSNPAGLATLKEWHVSSMSGSIMEDYNYLNVSGTYNTNVGVAGFGFSTVGASGGYATKIVPGTEANPVYQVDTTKPASAYYNNAILLSFGRKVPISSIEIIAGANLKLFSTGMSGSDITAGSASGNELDAGILIKPNSWLSVGSALQNALPASMGGKISYPSGIVEVYPAIWQNGIAVNLMGKNDSLIKSGINRLSLLLDIDYWPTQNTFPITYHAGLEFSPVEFLFLRAGIDQDLSGDGTGTSIVPLSNPTFGLGLNFSGFSFDYAYHPFAEAPGVTNNFFSLSYSPPLQAKKKIYGKIKITDPSDKKMTFSPAIKIKGLITGGESPYIETNNIPSIIGGPGTFEADIPLVIGKNPVEAVSYSEKTKKEPPIEKNKIRILRLITFPDVPLDYWVAEPISLLAMTGVVNGYADKNFKPEGNITRAEMCALLIRTLGDSATNAPPPSKAVFKDVKPFHWAAPFISKAYKMGTVKGYGKQLFKPSATITRDEGLAMIARFAGIKEEPYAGQFIDITQKNWAAKIISGAFNSNMLTFLQGKPFQAKKRLTRAEAVELIYKTRTFQDFVEKKIWSD